MFVVDCRLVMLSGLREKKSSGTPSSVARQGQEGGEGREEGSVGVCIT